jgi:hypothetical protein
MSVGEKSKNILVNEKLKLITRKIKKCRCCQWTGVGAVPMISWKRIGRGKVFSLLYLKRLGHKIDLKGLSNEIDFKNVDEN